MRRARQAGIICFSHLRWNFVYQRPQHLLSRAAQTQRVIYFEEPIFDVDAPRLTSYVTPSGVMVTVPHLPGGADEATTNSQLRALVDDLVADNIFDDLTFWYYSPMALQFSGHIHPDCTVYDCMDELSAFRFAPPSLVTMEKELLKRADVVFTGGSSLYSAKREAHRSVHCFPSSVDKEHFAMARRAASAQAAHEQEAIPHPRVGFFGVIDERMDLALVARLAELRPHIQFVMIGPLAKISDKDLPRAGNLHWLGPKDYAELPGYLAGWDAGFMPFALNESTRFISPTKTPEFLSAGLPLVSTNITDVAQPYGELGLVAIAHSPAQFARAMDDALATKDDERWLEEVDRFLADKSWDQTFNAMQGLIAGHRQMAILE
jgi:glycosyltransferase involved in cell wall biosynthesis